MTTHKTVEVVDDFYRRPLDVLDVARDGGGHNASALAAADREAGERIAQLLGLSEAPAMSGRFAMVGGDEDGGPLTTAEGWASVVSLAPPGRGADHGIAFGRLADQWEETLYVPLAFNRMVLFPGTIAHRVSSGLGQGADIALLVRVLTFE